MKSQIMKIRTPHIPAGISLEEGLSILSATGKVEEHDDEEELFYKVSYENFDIGFYQSEGKVTAAWYNDPTGRESDEGINQKVTLYLERYGKIEDWEEGINNGWIQFFNNNKNNIGMAYGVHKDVIRFNFFD
ncbi:hypothetical protein P8H27_18565 [Pseudomonas sp. sp1636]|uniref:hypothetical protein n=1 Tax=Pseudomonas sp. sp1636 TaxID=3036707 RepID=UPI0025A540F8|nr:hypothetical protein [Pseudomonas sp. sp1636]MDM8350882.1 hypothetical protein [Pseudomonas sp. sp1636]